MNGLKHFFEWVGEETPRGRQIVLLGTVFIFLIISSIILISGTFGIKISSALVTLYGTFTGLMAIIYGFYTSTSPVKTSEIIEKSIDKVFEKIKDKEIK